MKKIFNWFCNLFENDGVTYGYNSMSISKKWLENDPKGQEVSKKIQALWNEYVDENGVSRTRDIKASEQFNIHD